MRGEPVSLVTCAATAAVAGGADVRWLVRLAPSGPLDSGWRLAAAGERDDAVAGRCPTSLAWSAALAIEPALQVVGTWTVGTRLHLDHDELGRRRVLETGHSEPWLLPQAVPAMLNQLALDPAVVVPHALSLDISGAAERAVTASRLGGAVKVWRRAGTQESRSRAIAELRAAPVLVGLEEERGTTLVRPLHGLRTVLAFTSLERWDASRWGGTRRSATLLGQDALQPLLRGEADVLVIDPDHDAFPVWAVQDAAEMGQWVDAELAYALRARDLDRLGALAAAGGREWITVSDPLSRHGGPLIEQDPVGTGTRLPVFAEESHAREYPGGGEPILVTLDAVRRHWEPGRSLVAGLGSGLPPLELGWARLRTLGFASSAGIGPGGHAGRHGAPDTDEWERAFARFEEASLEAALAFVGTAVEGVHISIHLDGGKIEVAVAFTRDGRVHGAQRVPETDVGVARLAVLRHGIVTATTRLLQSLRSGGHRVPTRIRLRSVAGHSDGALSYDGAHASLVEDFTRWMMAEGTSPQRRRSAAVAAEEAVVPSVAADLDVSTGVLRTVQAHEDPGALRRAVDAGDARAAVAALVSAGTAVYVAVDSQGSPRVLSHPVSGVPALPIFSCPEAMAAFDPTAGAAPLDLEWLRDTWPTGAALLIDPVPSQEPLVLDDTALLRGGFLTASED